MPSKDDADHNHGEETRACGLEPETCGYLVTSCDKCDHNDHDVNDQDLDHDDGDEGLNKLIIGGVAIALGLVLRLIDINPLIPTALLITSMIAVGYPLALSGVKGVLKGTIGINFLVTIAAIGATLIGLYEEGALVVFLFSISLKLETVATDRARSAIEALMELRPEVALIKRGNEEVTVPVEDVLPGELFIVRPGDRIPLDGIVLEGETSVDQSTITGESVPIVKGFQDEVFASTINLDGVITVEVKRASSETVLSSILRMVSEAEGRRSPTETFVNRFAKYYTPAIILVAIIVALIPPLLFNAEWIPSIYNALVLLVIGCPCALTIATPVAMVSAITSASRNGVLIKGSKYIEQMNKAQAFAFDKTGTLTEGKLKVTDIVNYTDEDVLPIAAALEENSKHPIAEAINKHAEKLGITNSEVTEFKSQTGKGIEAIYDDRTCRIGSQRLFNEQGIKCPDDDLERLESEGKTVVLISKGEEVIGLIALMDKRRDDAPAMIQALKDQGITVNMLTGDNENTAKAIADQIGLTGYRANLLPDEKVAAIQEIKTEGILVMVGDGVNDAPALAAADVGIAMGGLGSDIALETADIVLLEDDLSRINYIQRLSKVTMARIRENIAVALIVKLIVVILGAMGLITLWMAVIIGDVGLTLLVILNSIRISRVKPR